ncbi:MAG: hypothetical protein AAB576_09840, partial [Elusimicrobiota bacterium]
IHGEVSVPICHGRGRMTEDHLQGGQILGAHDEMRSEGVTKIMKSEIHYVCGFERCLELPPECNVRNI